MDASVQADIIRNATTEVFVTMLGTDLHVGEPYEDANPLVEGEVIGMIGLGGYLTGSVSIHVGREQARDFTARLIGADLDEVTSDDDINDAVGELANMLAGAVKSALSGEGHIQIALPIVSTGKASLRVPKGRAVVVPFEDYTGSFQVEFVLGSR